MRHTKRKKTPGDRQNLTLRVGSGVLRTARTLAARDGLTLSELFERLTEEREGQQASRERIKRELLELASTGLDLGGAPYLGRDRAHER